MAITELCTGVSGAVRPIGDSTEIPDEQALVINEGDGVSPSSTGLEAASSYRPAGTTPPLAGAEPAATDGRRFGSRAPSGALATVIDVARSDLDVQSTTRPMSFLTVTLMGTPLDEFAEHLGEIEYMDHLRTRLYASLVEAYPALRYFPREVLGRLIQLDYRVKDGRIGIALFVGGNFGFLSRDIRYFLGRPDFEAIDKAAKREEPCTWREVWRNVDRDGPPLTDLLVLMASKMNFSDHLTPDRLESILTLLDPQLRFYFELERARKLPLGDQPELARHLQEEIAAIEASYRASLAEAERIMQATSAKITRLRAAEGQLEAKQRELVKARDLAEAALTETIEGPSKGAECTISFNVGRIMLGRKKRTTALGDAVKRILDTEIALQIRPLMEPHRQELEERRVSINITAEVLQHTRTWRMRHLLPRRLDTVSLLLRSDAVSPSHRAFHYVPLTMFLVGGRLAAGAVNLPFTTGLYQFVDAAVADARHIASLEQIMPRRAALSTLIDERARALADGKTPDLLLGLKALLSEGQG